VTVSERGLESERGNSLVRYLDSRNWGNQGNGIRA
jgi:hypothetical protein